MTERQRNVASQQPAPATAPGYLPRAAPLDFNHLRSFVTVAKFAHLTRAAEALHLSQPAISSHIKTLEEQLGVGLFDRAPSGMRLTPSGRQLLGDAERVIEAVQHMRHSAQGLRGKPTGSLSLGTVLDPAVLRVADLLLLAHERHPQIEIELHQVMSSDALAQVRSGELDASFYFGARPPADFGCAALRDIVYRVVLPAATAGELLAAPWSAIAERPWIVAPAPSSHRQLVFELFPGQAEPRRVIEADNESVIVNLVESGVGISLIREELAAQLTASGRGVVWPGRAVTTKLWLVFDRTREHDPLLTALREVLRDLWARP